MEWQATGKNEHTLNVISQCGFYAARIHYDGCIDFERAFNSPMIDNPDDIDQLHICDIDDLIQRLELLKDIAVKYFGEDWNQ